MRRDTENAEAGQLYAAAFGAHHGKGDLLEALELYRVVMVAHPNTNEAELSHLQTQKIVQAVVPQKVLFDAQFRLAIACIENERPARVEPEPAARASDVPGWNI